jgi:hypothetical protein
MEEEDKKGKKYSNTKLGGLSILILIISVLVILFSFIAPLLFVKESNYDLDFSGTGQIGDTIGGIMSPFIAISGVLLTFLAFFIQYKANRLQQDSFREELDVQKEQFKKNQFENQFYEMLKLHKDNVNELEIRILKIQTTNHVEGEKTEGIVNGRRVFDLLIRELELCYYTAKFTYPNKEFTANFDKAYQVFFHGLTNDLKEKDEFINNLIEIRQSHFKNSFSFLKPIVKDKLNIEWHHELNYDIFEGHSSQLAHYYRHLFLTVKFVVNQDEDLFKYEDKRKYLRILRAQLSNQEQTMLFYNWLSNFGSQWENEFNKFFTDFRMIHNIYQDLLIPDIRLDEKFEIEGGYRKEKDRGIDPLFEFQDW